MLKDWLRTAPDRDGGKQKRDMKRLMGQVRRNWQRGARAADNHHSTAVGRSTTGGNGNNGSQQPEHFSDVESD